MIGLFYASVRSAALAAFSLALGTCPTLAQGSGYIQSIGAGCAGGSNIVPGLTATGSVGAGRSVQFSVTGPAGMGGLIVLGDTLTQTQISPGCTLEVLLDPIWSPFYLYFTLDGAGSANITLPFPATLPSVVGQHLYTQAVVVDTAVTTTNIVSNGLELTGNVRVFVSNGSGFGNWNQASSWTQIDGGVTGLGIPGFDEDYDVVIIRAGDTIRQTGPMPRTLGLYELEEGATHRFENNADLAAFVVESYGKFDIAGVGMPPNGAYATPYLTVRNAAEVVSVGNVAIVRSNDPNFCTLVANAPTPFDTLPCTDAPGTPPTPQPSGTGSDGDDFHETTTHPAMTRIVMDNDKVVLTKPEEYLLNELRITRGVKAAYTDPGADQPINRSIKDWVVHGITMEDDLFPTIRVLRHFFDPYRGTGLFGRYAASNIWGFNDNSNSWNFVMARQHFYDALTKPAKVTRDTEMARTFRAIGQVMHLIQDLAAPPHVRNDAHPVYRPVEEYAQFNFGTEGQIMARLPQVTPGGAGGALYNFSLRNAAWWPAGWGDIPEFSALNDFWDTNQLTLNNFAGFSLAFPPGLAEVTNYNFWSLDTVLWVDHPNPSVADTNLVALFPAPPNGRIFYRNTSYLPTPLANGWVPVAKTAGPGRIALQTLAAAKDFGVNTVRSWFNWVPGVSAAKNRVGVGIYNQTTGPGPASVLDEYGEKLIPMAIGYSTGFVNFFFRGTVDIRLRWDHQNQVYKLIIENTSDDLIGIGNWELYQDDANGNNRALVPGANFPYPGSLAPNATFTATFAPSATKRGRYTLVFRGTLGTEVGTAVIGKVFDALRVEASWGAWADGDLYVRDFDDKLIFDNFRVGDYGEHDVDEPGGQGPENITMHKLVPGRLQFMVNYGDDLTKERSLVGGQCVTNTPPLFLWDDPTSPCYTQTNRTITVKTYHNSKGPIHTKYRTLTVPDRSVIPPANSPVGPIGNSWHITQVVTIDADGKITFSQ